MVNCKLSIHVPNCRGWPWVPPAVKSTHRGLPAARWPMHAAWRCRRKIMLAQLASTLTEWHSNSFTDLIDKMELWDWNVANKDSWSRLAKLLHSQKVSITWAGKMDQKLASVLVPEKMSWATATQSNRKCKTRIEKIGGSCLDTELTAWGLDAQVWNLLWTGAEAMKKGIPILKKVGFESVEIYPGQT